jgi:hypothetical protein
MAAMETTPAGTCPICGEPNDCAIARGENECWCFDEVFPPNLLERVPPQARGEICVCRNCVMKAKDASRE